MADPVFPLYAVTFHFDGGDDTKAETTSTMRPWLYTTDPGPWAVFAEAVAVWPTLNWRGEPRTRRLLAIEIEQRSSVPWALGWFSHETYRDGRSDEELRESFERWVRRWEEYQGNLHDSPGVPCLMGAEDRWRWKPLCTCEKCLREARAMIAH